MKTSTRQKPIVTIMLYSDDANPISREMLTQMVPASALELVQIRINEMNSRIKQYKIQPLKP
jgi:hypothetical protein